MFTGVGSISVAIKALDWKIRHQWGNISMRNGTKVFGIAAVMLLLAACGGIVLQGGASEVQVRTEEQIKDCENVGATHVSVADRPGQPGRNPDQISIELLKLAKSGAAQLGGNVIVEMTEVTDGAQSFTVFNCAH